MHLCKVKSSTPQRFRVYIKTTSPSLFSRSSKLLWNVQAHTVKYNFMQIFHGRTFAKNNLFRKKINVKNLCELVRTWHEVFSCDNCRFFLFVLSTCKLEKRQIRFFFSINTHIYIL